MSDITIALTLTDDELEEFKSVVFEAAMHGCLNDKITRAIERAESFVNDDDNMTGEKVNCAVCEGTGNVRLKIDGIFEFINCYYCSGTGKEYV